VVGGKTRATDSLRHPTLAIVAVAYAALAFADGGYSQELIAGATIGIWLLLAIGVVARVWPREPLPRPAVVAGGCLLALGVLSGLSMLWADDSGRAFFAVVRVCGYLGLFALVIVSSPRGGARPWLGGLATGLTVVAVASLATRFDPSLFGGGDRGLSSVLPASMGRLSYPIGYWNGLAACLAIDGVLLAWLGAQARTQLGRATAVALLPPVALALYLTSSRGGLGAALAGGLMLLVLERRRAAMLAGALLGGAGGGLLVLLAATRDDFLQGVATSVARTEGVEMGLGTLACAVGVGVARYLFDRRLARVRLPAIRWRVVVPALMVAAAVAVVAIHPVARVHEFTTIDTSGSGNAEPAQTQLISARGNGRAQFWEAAVDAFGSSPVEGIGAGNYELYWNAHPEAPLWLVNAHSLYLETLAELGVAGLLCVLGFFAVAIVAAVRRLGSCPEGEVAVELAVLAAAALSAGLEWTWQLPAAFVPMVIAAGLLTGAATSAPAGQRPRRAYGGLARVAIGAGAIAIVWLAVWTAGVALLTDLKLDSSRSAASRGDLVAAADDARDAANVQPWSEEPRLQLALVEELEGNLPVARIAALEAIQRSPTDWRPWVLLSRIDGGIGNAALSRGEFAYAGILSPLPLPSAVADHKPPGTG
jgi:hypothetical protein